MLFPAALIFFGPRLAFLVYWLIAPVRVSTAVAPPLTSPGW